jgi:hypothetical protein
VSRAIVLYGYILECLDTLMTLEAKNTAVLSESCGRDQAGVNLYNSW